MFTPYSDFLSLSLEQQLALARMEGTYLGWRWASEDAVAGLYYLPTGFFCEVYFPLTNMHAMTLTTSLAPLHMAQFADHVLLDDLFA